MTTNFKSLTFALVVGIGLVSCATPSPEPSSPSNPVVSYPYTNPVVSYPYTLTVDLAPTDTKSSLEEQYQIPVLVFDAEHGYAVMGVQQSQLESVQARLPATSVLESNVDRVTLDQTTNTDGSLGVWADGSLGVWADGSLGVWADGSLGVWADGSLGVWADGRFAPIPANTKNWQSIKLQQGQAQATQLGKNVTIAVIDSGIDLAHPAFKRSLVAGNLMRDFVDGDNIPNDTTNGHGTAVAGIALQIAPGAKILPLRVINKSGKGDADKLAQAINYAISSNVNVINISLSVAGVSEPVKKAIQAADAKKIPVFVSAGNRNSKLGFPASMAAGPYSVVSIGSVNADGIKSSFSNFGKDLELSAPGEAIVTAFPKNRSVVVSGTSMAAAVASGACALALGENPVKLTRDWVARQTWMTADPSIYRLDKNASFAYPSPDKQGYLGTLGYKGRLNLETYIKAVR